jgi:23S rRNA (uracil1939-C5)-methyltransferase
MARRVSRSRTPPRTVELTIDDIGARGDGLADLDGRRVYVPLTVPGDRVRVRLGNTRGDGVAAEMLDLLAPGPDRIEPVCRHFGLCGGCALQHLDDAAYGAWKREQVVRALARAGLGDVAVAPVLRTPSASRRRATFAALRRGGRVLLGFNERLSHRLVDLEECRVLDPAIAGLLPKLRMGLGTVLAEGGAVDVAVTHLDNGLDVLLTGGPEPGLRQREDLAAFAEAADLGRLSWRRAPSAPPEPIAARRPMVTRFGSVSVPVEPGAFLQASPAGEAALVQAVRDGVSDAVRIADLFAGAGTFTFPLAERAVVHAVEGDAGAQAALARAARGTGRVTTARRDLAADPLTAAELNRFDAVVFDPPRAGAREQATALAGAGAPVVVGVSCNPASFARDARLLVDGGYELTVVTPVDQFVWAAHVELVGVFRRSPA